MSFNARVIVLATASVFGLALICCAAFWGGLIPWAIGQDIARVERLQPASAVLIEDGQPGREVLIEGRLSRRNPEAGQGFVAYERYVAVRDGDGDRTWRLAETVHPPLIVDLAGGSVRVVGDYSLYNASDSRETDTERFVGLRARAPVIAVGVLVEGQEEIELAADFVAGGTRDEYLSSNRTASLWLGYGGWLVGGCGFLLIVAAVALVLVTARRRKP